MQLDHLLSNYKINDTMSQAAKKLKASSSRAQASNTNGKLMTNGDKGEDVGLLETFTKAIDDIRSLVACRICTRPMYEPYTTPCGHSFCYSCLSQWLSNHRRKKTCPGCRARISQQPVPDYTASTNAAEAVILCNHADNIASTDQEPRSGNHRPSCSTRGWGHHRKTTGRSERRSSFG